jgi:hypothetical protein
LPENLHHGVVEAVALLLLLILLTDMPPLHVNVDVAPPSATAVAGEPEDAAAAY